MYTEWDEVENDLNFIYFNRKFYFLVPRAGEQPLTNGHIHALIEALYAELETRETFK